MWTGLLRHSHHTFSIPIPLRSVDFVLHLFYRLPFHRWVAEMELNESWWNWIQRLLSCSGCNLIYLFLVPFGSCKKHNFCWKAWLIIPAAPRLEKLRLVYCKNPHSFCPVQKKPFNFFFFFFFFPPPLFLWTACTLMNLSRYKRMNLLASVTKVKLVLD